MLDTYFRLYFILIIAMSITTLVVFIPYIIHKKFYIYKNI